MHSQVLVIYPENIELDDIMYPYQEIDKTISGQMADDRCNFYLAITEEDIPQLLTRIKYNLKKKTANCLKKLQYRANHTYEETKKEFGVNAIEHTFEAYKIWVRDLQTCEKIKDLPYDDPEQIKFILNEGYSATNKWIDIYIKGIGYGTFHNPYELWDSYDIVDRHRFSKGTKFLVGNNGEMSNQMPLKELNVKGTIANIHELTYVWENIIFCENDPSKSVLSTINDIRFKHEWNKHCMVEDLEKVLYDLSEEYADGDYQVIALDVHY